MTWLSGSPGRQPSGPWPRASARAALLDVSKAHARLIWATLVAYARLPRLPLRMRRILAQLRAMPRYLSYNDVVLGECLPRCGAVAGCSWAGLATWLYLVPLIDRVLTQVQNVEVVNVVDDSQLQCMGSVVSLTRQPAKARHLLRDELREHELVV